MDNENTEIVIKDLVTKTYHMSLATASNNKPWVCEVHFATDTDMNLYFVSLQNTRHCQEIVANPNVSGNIVAQHALTELPNGLYFEGEAIALEEPTDEQIENYCNRLERDKAKLIDQLKEPGGRNMYQIKVSNWAVFGKFNNDAVKKHEILWGNHES